MRNEIQLNFTKATTYECGAALLAGLAYPVDHDDHRAKLQASLCSLYLRKQYVGTEAANFPQVIKPAYAFRSEKEAKRDIKTLERRLRDRCIAGHMLIPHLQKALGKKPKLPSRIKSLSLNQLSAMVCDDAKQSDPENVEARIWRPSRPVAHIGAALAVALNDSEREGISRTSWGDILRSLEFIGQVVSYAQQFETLIENSSEIRNRLHLTTADLVKIRIN